MSSCLTLRGGDSWRPGNARQQLDMTGSNGPDVKQNKTFGNESIFNIFLSETCSIWFNILVTFQFRGDLVSGLCIGGVIKQHLHGYYFWFDDFNLDIYWNYRNLCPLTWVLQQPLLICMSSCYLIFCWIYLLTFSSHEGWCTIRTWCSCKSDHQHCQINLANDGAIGRAEA